MFIRTSSIGALALLTVAVSGQSDPANFEFVVNLQGEDRTISGSVGSDTQVNVFQFGLVESTTGSPFLIGDTDGSDENIEINVLGGAIGNNAIASGNVTINLLEGVIRRALTLQLGASLNVEGGTVEQELTATDGSEVVIAGGAVGPLFSGENSDIAISGGSLGADASITGGSLIISGGETFERLIVENATVEFTGGSIGNNAAVINSSLLIASPAFVGPGLDVGEGTAAVMTGGDLGEAPSVRSGGSLEMQDGTIADNASIFGELVVSGGAVGSNTRVFSGGVARVSGGTVADGLRLRRGGGTLELLGGELGETIAERDGVVTIEGGSITDLTLQSATATQSGGEVGVYSVDAGSTFNLVGSEFSIGGTPIDGPGNSPIEVSERDVELTGVLDDGSNISISLASTAVDGADFVASSATLTVTIPAGGCNAADLAAPFGDLDVADVVAFLSGFGAGDLAIDFAAPFGTLDIADVVEFLRLFGQGCPA